MKVSGLRLWRLRKRGGHMQIWPKQGRGRITAVIGTAIVAVLGLAACGSTTPSAGASSSGPSSPTPPTPTQQCQSGLHCAP